LTPDGWLRAANIEALGETLLPFAEKDKPPNETALADAQNCLKYMDKVESSAVWPSDHQRHYFDNGFSALAALTA